MWGEDSVGVEDGVMDDIERVPLPRGTAWKGYEMPVSEDVRAEWL